MFNLRTAIVLGFGFTVFSTPARAGTPIEFEFGGVFTQTNGTVHQVGQSFTTTIRFDPDAPDVIPSPTRGEYAYISWTAPYRTSTPIVLVPPAGRIVIDADTGGGSHGWRINYEGGAPFAFNLDIDYPPGTFATDALPQTLDLSTATATRFRAFDAAFGVDLRGTINSFRVVPEPGVSGGILFRILIGRRGRLR